MNTFKANQKANIPNIVIEVVLFIVAIFVLFPIVLLFLTTFKQPQDIYNPFVIPNFTNISNYINVFARVNIPKAFMNTAVIAFSTIAINILISSMAGYSICRSKEKIVKLIFFYFVFGWFV